MSRHPALIEAQAAREKIHRILIEFGGSPSSVTTIRRQKPDKPSGVLNRKRDIGGENDRLEALHSGLKSLDR